MPNSEIHGDRYDYSLIDYVNSQKKIKIICREHGVFEQKPNAHISGKGCNKCGGSFLRSKEEIITKFKEVHGNRYDYSLVDYINSNKKVKIICSEHGIFEQLVSNHFKGNNCPDCAGRPIYDNEKIIAKFREAHSDRYNYSLVKYINSHSKALVAY